MVLRCVLNAILRLSGFRFSQKAIGMVLRCVLNAILRLSGFKL